MFAQPDELQETVTALLREFAPPAVPITPIAAVDFFADEHGGFVTVELSDNSQIYITLDYGEAATVFHAQAPKPKPAKLRHLFSVRLDREPC